MMKIISFLMLFLAMTSSASADTAGSNNAFAIHAGEGSLYGTADGMVVAVEYQVLVRPLLRISPEVLSTLLMMRCVPIYELSDHFLI